MKTSFDFTDQVVLITGAAGGIGRKVAQLVHESGGHLVLVDLNQEATQAVADTLTQGTGRILVIAANSADGSSLDALVAEVTREFGRVDHIVPAAGIYPTQLVKDMDDQDWRLVQSINLDGVFMLIRRLIPIIAKGGSIVNLASVAGHRGSHSHAHYAASKAGIIALTRTLALELGPDVRVNAVSPGIILTTMTEDLVATKGDVLLAQTPLDRNGTAAEVASVIGFLMSDAASFVNGETLHVNGGLFMAG